MKNYLILPALLAALFTPFMYADVEGSVGVDSDYFWRGVSQNDGNPSMNLNLQWNGDGFYAGTWIGQVDFGNEVKHENDFYAGYALAISDNMAVDVGLIQYKYDTLIEDMEEVYVGVSLNNFELYHSINLDNSDLTFTKVKYHLPFVTELDVSLVYAMGSDEITTLMGVGDDDYFGMELSKDLGNFTLSAMVMDRARHGDIMDNASVALHYNF